MVASNGNDRRNGTRRCGAGTGGRPRDDIGELTDTMARQGASEEALVSVSLSTFVGDFAAALYGVDALRPVAVNQRSGVAFQAGIGPHSEANTVRLVVERMAEASPAAYGKHALSVPYPQGRRSCDICLGTAPDWAWAIEVKLLRLLGDNGKPNDNILMHILSPYPEHRSALTDCTKLLSSPLGRRKAIVILGYDYDDWPMEPAIEAFEALAAAKAKLGLRLSAPFSGLVHPVHERGAVFGWELLAT